MWVLITHWSYRGASLASVGCVLMTRCCAFFRLLQLPSRFAPWHHSFARRLCRSVTPNTWKTRRFGCDLPFLTFTVYVFELFLRLFMHFCALVCVSRRAPPVSLGVCSRYVCFERADSFISLVTIPAPPHIIYWGPRWTPLMGCIYCVPRSVWSYVRSLGWSGILQVPRNLCPGGLPIVPGTIGAPACQILCVTMFLITKTSSVDASS